MVRKKLSLNLGGDSSKIINKIEAYKNPKSNNPKMLKAEIIDWLIASFPKCFTFKRNIPFKRRIENDLFQAAQDQGKQYTKKEIEKALSFYSNHLNYLQATIDGTHRFDLEGKPVEKIFAVHKRFAKKRLVINAKKQTKFRGPRK